MFKYSPVSSYSLRNLHKNQIYFNNPLHFNDPFDTLHPAKIQNLSNKKFIELYCKSNKRSFNKETLLAILNKTITTSEFYQFCCQHIEYFIDFSVGNETEIYRSKKLFLDQFITESGLSANKSYTEIGDLLTEVKLRTQITIQKTFQNLREESLSKIGVCCFLKNNRDLLMWSHYADSHQGFCLEFDSDLEPFSKAFDVTYEPEIPDIDIDLLFDADKAFESIRKLLSYKSLDWFHEEELRVFHREKNVSYTYPPRSLKGIYFGLKSNKNDVEIICSVIKSQNPSVKFYKMEKLDLKFGVKPVEFNYHTPIEVQSMLMQEIFKDDRSKEFTLNELYSLTKLSITYDNLKNHLEEMNRNGLLAKNNNKYKLTL